MNPSASADVQLPLWGDDSPRLSVRFRESRRSRRLCVRVDHDARVEVVVPRGTSRSQVTRFLAEHEEWIARRVAHAASRTPEPAAFPPPRIDLPAVGESWRLHVAGGAGALRLRSVAPGLLQLRGAGEEGAAPLLRRWVVARARELLPARVQAFATEAGARVEGVQVRTQRTRWGSCSTRRVISLNAAVMFQPPRVLSYLLAHELAHLQHMNHSRDFWDAVAALEPDWRELDRQLVKGWEHVPRWFRRRPGED